MKKLIKKALERFTKMMKAIYVFLFVDCHQTDGVPAPVIVACYTIETLVIAGTVWMMWRHMFGAAPDVAYRMFLTACIAYPSVAILTELGHRNEESRRE